MSIRSGGSRSAGWLAEPPPQVLVLSSASSKTAYGRAVLLRGRGRQVVGLTSSGNVACTTSLGVSDRVLSSEQVAALAPVTTAYVDLAGNAGLCERVHAHLRQDLVLDLVGVTHQDGTRADRLEGAPPSAFFASDRIRERTRECGREGFAEGDGQSGRTFAPAVDLWVDVVESHRPAGRREAWLEVLSGKSVPRTIHVLQL